MAIRMKMFLENRPTAFRKKVGGARGRTEPSEKRGNKTQVIRFFNFRKQLCLNIGL